MTLIDSSIPMYLVGAPHANKDVARSLLERAIADGEALVTDAEVLQEILHRYAAIDRRDAIAPAMAAVLGVVDDVFPIEGADVQRAAAMLDATDLSARDVIHLAVMQRRGVARIMTFDRGFDAVAGIARYQGHAS